MKLTPAERWERVALLKEALARFDHIPTRPDSDLMHDIGRPDYMAFREERVDRIRKLIQDFVTETNGGGSENFFKLCELFDVPPEAVRRAIL